jgi:alcohol dehydrogenase (cytochrome c)
VLTPQKVHHDLAILGAGEPDSETWKDGKERWRHGGGSIWETATYDPDSDTFYQGIGNAGPDFDTEYGAALVVAVG